MTEKRKELLDQIEAFLFEMVRALEIPPARSGPGRPLILPAVCLWAGLLVCVLRGFDSQLTLWRLLAVDGFWRFGSYSVSDQAVYKRLSQSGLELLQNLFEKISAVLHERLAPFAQHQLALFASEVYALDATTLDKIARVLPTLRGVPSGDDQLLPGKAAALFDRSLPSPAWMARPTPPAGSSLPMPATAMACSFTRRRAASWTWPCRGQGPCPVRVRRALLPATCWPCRRRAATC